MIVYLLTDGKGRYIRYDTVKNKYVTVTSKFLAEKWDDRLKAKNILESCLPKNIKKKFRVRETEDDRTPSEKAKSVEETPRSMPEHKPAVASIKKTATPDNGAKLSVSVAFPATDNQNLDKVRQNVTFLKEFAYDRDQRVSLLYEQLSQIDLELSDLAHYMEFYNLNACRGYKAYKEFRDARRKRRIIKDELDALRKLGDCTLDPDVLADVQASVENMGDRRYRPRVRVDLFENV